MRFNENVLQIQSPPITEVKGWLAGRIFPADKPLIDLCQAIPNYAPPAELTEHLQQSINNPQTYNYSPDEGLLEARTEVLDWYQRHYLADLSTEQICLTVGASQAFWLSILCTCQAGDEVIVQLPAYFDHPMGLQALGIKPIFAPFDPANKGLPEVAQLERLITPRTRAILLVTPSNPTGAVIPPEQIESLFLLAQQHQLTLILDETYNSFIDSVPHQLFNRSDWPDTFIHLASFGKTFAITGLRCGALLGSETLISEALKIQDSMVVCQPRSTQVALTYGCRELDDWVADNCAMMKQRHDRFVAEFAAASLKFELAASGSFFAWIKHPWDDLTGRQAARRLADDANLICLPGEAFGPGLESYLRLAFGNIDHQNIPAAVARFSNI